MIIDATNLLIGRMATRVAKKALLGEKIDVINCEKAVISGTKANLVEKYKLKLQRGQIRKGPYVYRRPDMFVRRTMRGMLPYKQAKGREAFSRIRCYVGLPEELKKQRAQTITEANVAKLPVLKYVPVGELCRLIGAK
jgi:large subunit ribosomal protein L13